MPVVRLETEINAPIDRVFDLARSVDLHAETMSRHKERAVGGRTSGLIELGETVTWEAVHFGVTQNLTSKITGFDRPNFLQDVMVSGAFRCFTHDHFLIETDSGTLMRDVFDYESPLWILGRLADALFLESYMTALLKERNRLIKKTAESENWRKFINEHSP